MKSNINVDGLEVNPNITEIIKQFKNIKQGNILENSRVRVQYEVRNHDLELLGDYLVDQTKQELISRLTNYMIRHFENSIIEHKGDESITYEFDALVLPLEHFKHVVDYVIRTLPQHEIDKIKNKWNI